MAEEYFHIEDALSILSGGSHLSRDSYYGSRKLVQHLTGADDMSAENLSKARGEFLKQHPEFNEAAEDFHNYKEFGRADPKNVMDWANKWTNNPHLRSVISVKSPSVFAKAGKVLGHMVPDALKFAGKKAGHIFPVIGAGIAGSAIVSAVEGNMSAADAASVVGSQIPVLGTAKDIASGATEAVIAGAKAVDASPPVEDPKALQRIKDEGQKKDASCNVNNPNGTARRSMAPRNGNPEMTPPVASASPTSPGATPAHAPRQQTAFNKGAAAPS